MRGPFENALGNAKLAVLSLFIMLIVSIVIIVILAASLANAPNRVTYYEQHCDGSKSVLSANSIPDSQVRSFVVRTWTSLNSWPVNGRTNSIENLVRMKQNFTPRFISQYKSVLASLDQTGFVSNYVLSTIPLYGSNPELELKEVKQISGGWAVKASFISRFYFNPYKDEKTFAAQDQQTLHAEEVLQQTITFKVVRYPSPSGLALDGFINVEHNSINNKALTKELQKIKQLSQGSEETDNGGNNDYL
ncbi:DUF2895 family protein [Cysteiniphilum litorale]|uniref:DUF2895 family protein n=1 Tax=Cysteiniphilum litorale TaxID=2056700 RepID=UPI003F8807AD